jgi:hypothetical protein|tara:strand:+ start:31731 stop:32516 length:786 start_codon:yes stop_codon:yes gene_type:complete
MFFDRATVSSTRRTQDGYLIADAKVSRSGCYTYAGREVGRPDLASVIVYRPPEEVFSRDTIATLAAIPLTLDHPSQPVTADNWKSVAVGEVGSDMVRDGEHVRLSLILKDAAAIRAWEAGKRELSLGYNCTLDWTAGTAPSGERYSAIQRGLTMNHLAIVDQGRAGSECRIGDSKGVSPQSNVAAITSARMQFDAANNVRRASGRPAHPDSEFHRIADAINGVASPASFATPHSLGSMLGEERALRDAALRSRYARSPIQN